MKHLKFIIPVVFSLIATYSFAGVGDLFPNLTGESLDNKTIELPAVSKGKYCLVGMASSQTAETDLQSWMQPIYDMFIRQTTFIPIDYNLDIFFIPMFSGANQSAYNFVMKKTKEEIDTDLAPHVLFYKGDLGSYKEKLGLIDENVPYFFVLDGNGIIIYTVSGAYSSEKLAKIESFVSE